MTAKLARTRVLDPSAIILKKTSPMAQRLRSLHLALGLHIPTPTVSNSALIAPSAPMLETVSQ